MKNILFFTLLVLVSCKTDIVIEEGFRLVELSADEISVEDAFVEMYEPDNYGVRNFGDRVEISTYNGTSGGSPFIVRSFIAFDLDLPEDAVVEEAMLSLFSCSSAGFGDGHRNEGDNSAVISRVTDSWEEMEVTWNTQPRVSLQNTITLASSSSAFQDYTNIDLSDLLQDHVNSGASQFSISLASVEETPYRSLLFCSSEVEDESRRPTLSVKYQTAK